MRKTGVFAIVTFAMATQHLLETQEESFRFYSHDCTMSAGLIERQKMQLIPMISHTRTHTHTHTHTLTS